VSWLRSGACSRAGTGSPRNPAKSDSPNGLAASSAPDATPTPSEAPQPGSSLELLREALGRGAPTGAAPVGIPNAAALGAGHLLALQRVAGNGAVHRLLHPSRGRPEASGQRASRPTIDVAQRWGTEEHRQLGEGANLGEDTDIDIGGGTMLTYGEMVGLAGDYFQSIGEIRALAGTPAGREQLRWARWWALRNGSEPSVSERAKARVRDRYYRLAANNLAHFQASGGARNAYEQAHIEALTSAFLAGVAPAEVGRWEEAVTGEAFSNHFLTDMFAAGHIRTPRPDIKAWYTGRYPDSVDRFINYTADWIARELDRLGETPGLPNSQVAANMAERIRALGGSAIRSFSIGDIVSMAVHNLDNRTGLNVVSEVNASGQAVPGGFQWQAGGEGRLGQSAITQQMATAAVRASFADLVNMRNAGRQTYQGAPVPQDQVNAAFEQALRVLRPFAALRYVPGEGSGNRPIATGAASGPGEINWRWGSIDPTLRAELDTSVRSEIAGTLRSKAGEVPTETSIFRGMYTIRQIRTAFLSFCTHLANTGFSALETAMGASASPPAPAPDAGVTAGAGEPRDAGVPLPGGVP
jgi:hypothetical protein